MTRSNKAPAPNHRPRFPLGGLGEFEITFKAITRIANNPANGKQLCQKK
jgi:hypothetical protein